MAKVAADLDTVTELGRTAGGSTSTNVCTAPQTPPISENGWTQGPTRLSPLTATAPAHGPAVVWPSGTTHIVRFGPSSTARTLAVAKENTIARALFGKEGYAAWIRAERRGMALVCAACALVGHGLGVVAMALNDPGHPSILVAALLLMPSSIEAALNRIPRAMSKMNSSFTVIFSTLNVLTWAVCMSAVRGWHTADCVYFAAFAAQSYFAGIMLDATASRAEFKGKQLFCHFLGIIY